MIRGAFRCISGEFSATQIVRINTESRRYCIPTATETRDLTNAQAVMGSYP